MTLPSSLTTIINNLATTINRKITNTITTHENKTSSSSQKGHSQAGSVPQTIGKNLSAGTDNGYYARADHVHTVDYSNILNVPDVATYDTVYTKTEIDDLLENLIADNIMVNEDGNIIIGSTITGLLLTATKNIIQSNQTTTLTGVAYDAYSHMVVDEPIQLYKDGVLIDIFDTNENGEITYTYTGNGSGVHNFTIRNGRVQSEIYEVLDATFYDKASNGVHNRWDIENASIDYSNDYLELSSPTGTQFHILNISDGNIIEFDYYCTSLTEQSISLRQSSTPIWSRSLQQMGIDVNTWCNVKIKVNNREWWIWVDGIDKTPTSHSIGEFNRFFLRVTNDYRIRYKNFVVYPI